MTIQVDSLFFSYAQTPVLENVSFTVEPGEFIGIFGPNGGGKTTLLNLLMGFLTPAKGTLRVLGKPPKEARPKMGWVPQNFYFDRKFPISAEEVVLEGRLSSIRWLGQYTKEDRTIAKTRLEEVGMKEWIYDPLSALSGGQIQRVLIARALAGEPSVLFLDEPTASLDFATQLEIFKMLRTLKGKMTILMVTHDLKNAVNQVDRLFCVQKNLIPMSHEMVCAHFALGLYHSPEATR